MSQQNRHPRALPFLFLTEMWERFGFYVVQGLLVLYMTQYFGYTDDESYTILGVFTALAYISPLAGGYLASKLLGYVNSILWGGLLLILGYLMLSLPYAKTLLYPALATIVVGNGFFKPNISSLLGAQYSLHDTRREAGFTLFYIGINIGVFLAGVSSGYIKNLFGWRMSFSLAGLGLIIGVLTFLYGLAYLKNESRYFANGIKQQLKNKIIVLCVLTILALTFLFKIKILTTYLLPAIGIVLLIVMVVTILQQTLEARKNMILLSILILSSILFWMLFLQIFYSANLFIDRLVIKNLFGIPLTTTIFYASEAIFIILLGPLFATLWHTLTRHNANPSPLLKFMLGIFAAGLGFLLLAISIYFPSHDQIHPLWVFAAYLLITIGELLLSPIGLSAVTQLAPPSLVSVMMGVWFVAMGFGGIFAGWLAKLASIPETVETPAAKLLIYQSAFFDYAYIAFFAASLLLIVQLGLRKYFVSSHSE